MMKGPVGLLCLCWLLAAVGPSVQLLSTSPGHTYTYEVESTTLAGIPELADQYSGLSLLYTIKMDAVSKDKTIFTFKDVRVGKLNEEVSVSYPEDITFQHSPSPHYERELSKPFAVHHDEHEIVKVEFPQSEPMWSVNIKKAIVEKFQLDLKSKSNPVARPGSNHIPRVDPSASIYSVYEDGIGGECETRYNILSVPSLDHPDQSQDVLNVTKVKNYRNCRSRPVFEFDNFVSQGCALTCKPHCPSPAKNVAGIWRESSSAYESGCPFGFEPDHHPVKSYSISWYNISSASHGHLVESIWSEGKTVLNLNGMELMVISQTNISLVKKSGLRSQPPSVSKPVQQYENLEFQLPEVPYFDSDDSKLYSVLGPLHEAEVKQSAIRMIQDMVIGIISTDPDNSKNAGPHVIQIANALSVLKQPALEDIYNELSSEKLQKVVKKRHMMRKVFLDISAIAATNEIALFVRDLIVSKRVSDSEAAELVQGIGKNSDEPSTEVIQAFLDLLDLPRVQKSRPLLPAVGIALGRMIEDSCVEENEPVHPQLQVKPHPQAHIPHPRTVKKYDSLDDESSPQPWSSRQPNGQNDNCSPQELKTYIQTIVQKLEQAQSLNKILAYVETLSYIGTPIVVPYIQPYITGEAPNAQALTDEDSDFLSVSAIYSLHALVQTSADELLPILSSIYFDQSNDYDQRIAAVHVLLRCNPPLTLIEGLATDLKYETNHQVGSFVYSLLSDLANSTLPCDRKMAQKIQLVLAHALDFGFGMQYSGTSQYTYYDDDNDYGVSAKTSYVASNTSAIPRAFHASLKAIRGPFLDKYLEIGGRAKGIEELWEKLTEPSGILTQVLSSLGSNVQVRNVPQVLDIVKNRLLFASPDTEIPRAVLYFNVFNRINYLTVDEQYVVEILQDVVEYFRQVDASSGYSASYVKIWMPSTFLRVVPSSAGLPVVIRKSNPVILALSVDNLRVATNKQKQAPLTSTVALSASLDVKVHMDSIAMALVIDPANEQVHGAAFEKTSELSVSNVVEFALDMENHNYALSWKPKMPHQVFYHNSRPSTFIGQAALIRKPKEEWLGEVNEIQTIPEPFQYDSRHEARPLGLSLRIKGDSVSPWADIPLPFSATADSDGTFAAILEMIANPEMINREIHVYLEPHRKNPASEIVFSAAYDNHLKITVPEPEKENDYESDEEEEFEKAVASIYGRSYRVPDAKSAVERLIKKTEAVWAPTVGHDSSDPVPATVIHSLDLTMAVKGDRTKHHALRLLYAHSLGFRSNWFEAVAHCPGEEKSRPFQICSSLCAAYPETPSPFYVPTNTLKSQRARFVGEIGWGSDCHHQGQIRVQGEMKKSEEQLSASSGAYDSPKGHLSPPWYYKQCQVDRAEGQTQSYACQQAIAADSELHTVELDIIAPELPPQVYNVTAKFDLLVKYLLYPNLEFNPVATNEEGKLTIVLKYNDLLADTPLVDIEVLKPTETLVFSKLYLPLYEPPSTLYPYEETFMDQFFGGDYFPECNLMEDYLQTFDNVTVELPDNQCQYILAHDASPDKAFTVIASQIDLQTKTKALSMALAGHSIKVSPPHGESVSIVLDGVEREVTPRKPVVLDFDKDSELRMYVRRVSGSTVIVIHAVDHNIVVKYDGKNAVIKMPRAFQGDQVGLCGDFNDEQFHEFTGPLGCTYLEEEDFVKSYAVPGQSCPKPSKPQGPAFCPPGVEYKPHSKVPQDDDNDDISEPSGHKKPRPESSEIEAPRPRSPHWPKQPTPPRLSPQVQGEPSESDEDEQPEGPSECLKQYTHTFVDSEGKTCFSTQPAFKCHSQCRSVRSKTKEMPFHCLPASKLEKDLKDQASRGVLHHLQNKPVEKRRHIDFPEKCM